MSHYKSKTMKHKHSKSQQMQTYQRLWQTLVLASQATKSGHPSKTALHDPSAWQQDEPLLCFWQFYDVQAYPVSLSCLCWIIASVSLGYESQLYQLSALFFDP